jgi:glycosyltransferase involved in cell wall biosynthesis
MTMTANKQPTISICLATYKRPELLKKLLLSLCSQETAGEFSFEISVADNDYRRSGEAVVRELNAQGERIMYDVEPEQNISLARNRSLSHAAGNYMAIIDDDIHADPQWLLNLYRTAKQYNADIVHGPVIPQFHPKTPSYIKESGIFMRDNPPTGSTENYGFTAANCLVRGKLIAGVAQPFDPAFGRTGGEDAVFFEKLKKQGNRHVWCSEAKVFSFISPRKTSWRWIAQREFRIGNGYLRTFDRAAVELQLPQAARTRNLIRRVAKIGYPIPLYICRGLFDVRYNVKAIERLRDVAFYAGIIAHFWGLQYEEYRGQ